MSAWLVKTRRALSRNRRDARVCGHTTTAMHKLSTPPPPPPLPFLCQHQAGHWATIIFSDSRRGSREGTNGALPSGSREQCSGACTNSSGTVNTFWQNTHTFHRQEYSVPLLQSGSKPLSCDNHTFFLFRRGTVPFQHGFEASPATASVFF